MDLANKRTLSKIFFGFALTLILIIALLYLYNIISWGNIPNYGFGYRSATGVGVVGFVMDPGQKAGLQLGDRVLKVNDQSFKNLKELYAVRNRTLGEKNTYLIERHGQQFEVTIINYPYGIFESFKRSGLPYLVGLCYLIIGTLVFLMKPHQRTSWIFFLFGSTFGLMLTFLVKLGDLRPHWLGTIHILFYTFTPATFIHLAMSFPEERNFIKKHPYAQALPYFISIILFILIRWNTPLLADAPKNSSTVSSTVWNMIIGK